MTALRKTSEDDHRDADFLSYRKLKWPYSGQREDEQVKITGNVKGASDYIQGLVMRASRRALSLKIGQLGISISWCAESKKGDRGR